MMPGYKNAFFLLVALLVGRAYASGVSTTFDLCEPDSSYPIARRVRYSFTAQNIRNTVLEKGDLWVYVPVRQTAAQWCRRVETTHPAELTLDALGNQILHFEIRDMPPYGATIITIKADVRLASAPNSLPIGDMTSYMSPVPRVESDAPRITALAKGLAHKSPRATAERILEWVSDNIEYAGYHSGDRGALWALDRGRGDCSEHASLFTALCRAAGIPARRVSGYVCDGNMALRPFAYHNWAEFFDGDTWRIADPREGNLIENHSRYIALSILESCSGIDEGDRRRLFRSQGEGLKVVMDK